MIYLLVFIIIWLYLIGGRCLWLTKDMYLPKEITETKTLKIAFWLLWWLAATFEFIAFIQEEKEK